MEAKVRKLIRAYLVVFLLLPITAFAAQIGVDIGIGWVNATENVDGTPYDNHDFHRFCLGLTISGCEVADVMLSDSPIPTITFTNIPITLDVIPGSPVSVYVRMTHTNLNGDESGYSNQVVKGPFAADLLPVPNPSGGISVNATITACEVGYVCSGGD